MILSNTRVLATQFEYLEPGTKEEALRALDKYKDSGIWVLAGGTDLIVKMKTGLVRPQYLLSIKGLPELRYIKSGNGLRIGAVTPIAMVEKSETVKAHYSALYEAARSMASPTVRNMGTIGGNLCNGSPAADTAPALMVLGSTCILASLDGKREVPIEEFFLAPGLTVLRPGELLEEIRVPSVSNGSGSSFLKIGRVSADISKINVAVYLERAGNVCMLCRIALGSVGPTPVRAKVAEDVLKGSEMNQGVISDAAQVASNEINPLSDIRSTADYRKQVSKIMVEEAIKVAWTRSGGEGLV